MISGLGPHRSEGDGFAGDASLVIGVTVARSIFKGVESPNDAMTKLNLRLSAYTN